ncbi:type I-E CRISPR-associated protein Cse2/CasB [Apilactobacillus timberlakei]|uniref:type I-E CRISPR-associated protein Cse2/CasB n=1 Tax=Apilactobacillus timberlakei TaxID=2008380 RepID=UPI001127558F|nr:type I-E CRISPR-associated protein Cse2/CasB [Apilactobacillus timberlakei]TPR19562.1 type I-E CRISPR-associated protein Cse2/CasB [Apilactobacillus timberlakei]TPR20539.1 type I-E CRISPR-associated protein Cse2/CasB [Apilactobacillus timberlakei]TPR22583.1 type I-E CRISPR-associated protein Cse2/CasB [Apilactobacillus timberlakei]
MECDIYSVTAGIIKSLDHDLEASYTKAILAELRNSINRSNHYSGIVWQLLFERLPKDFLNNHRNGNLTKEERVILSTMQLYAIHQQGKQESVNSNFKEHFNDAGHFSIQFDGNNFYLDAKGSSDDKFTSQRMVTFKNINKLTEYMEQWKSKLAQDPFADSGYVVNLGGSLSNYRIRLNDKVALDRRFNRMITSSTYEELLNNLRHLIKIVKAKSLITINYPKLAKDLYQFMGSDKDREKVQLMWSQSYYFNNDKEENTDEK